jgi:MYXO-CTERM domain-containing protein
MSIKIRYWTGALASSAILAGTGGHALAQAVATDSYCIPAASAQLGGFVASDIGDTLVANGVADILPDGRCQLTKESSASGQASTIYYNQPLSFRYTDDAAKTPRQFHVFFSFSMGPTALEVNAGSGLAFLVQNNLESSVGSNGDGIGYGGLKKSFQFEFDTHKDTPSAGTVNYGDPIEDHIGFMLDGNQSEHVAYYKPLDAANNQIEFNSSGPVLKVFYVWIDYAGGTGPDAKKYKLYLSETKEKPAAPIVWEEHKDFVGADPMNPNFPESGFDPDYWLSTQMAGQPGQGWVGFSAATYGLLIRNDHFIHEFEFSNKGIPCACQGADACKTATETLACSAGPMTKDSGVCVECTEADETPCTGNTPVCDKENEVCVECNTNTDCTMPGYPHCDETGHTCVPCVTDDDCAQLPDTPVCVDPGTATAVCGECNDDDDCADTPATPLCSAETHTCEECDTNADCPGEKPVCDPAVKMCSPCSTDADCNGYPNEPACALTGDKAGECVPCTEDKHCPADMPICDPAIYTCDGCTKDTDCTFVAPVCDVPSSLCEPCVTDAQCDRFPDKPTCQITGPLAGQCGPTFVNTDVIEGGGCACAVAGSTTNDGIFAGLMTALGAAAAMTRRRRRASKQEGSTDV